MQVDKIQLRYYKALPLAGLCSPLIDRLGKAGFPASNRQLIESIKDSIQVNGMRNPLTVEWFDVYNDHEDADNKGWGIRIGNNRAIALMELGEMVAPCLVLVPHGVEGPAGTYESITVEAALTLFSAEHPWWHSQILRHMLPNLVPRGA